MTSLIMISLLTYPFKPFRETPTRAPWESINAATRPRSPRGPVKDSVLPLLKVNTRWIEGT